MKYMKSEDMFRPVADETFTYVDSNVLTDKALTPEDRLVYVLLCSNVKHEGENVVTANVKEIIEGLNILESVVHASIAHLENRGVIKID